MRLHLIKPTKPKKFKVPSRGKQGIMGKTIRAYKKRLKPKY